MPLAALPVAWHSDATICTKHKTIKVNRFTAKKIQKSEMNDMNDYKLRQNNLSCVVCKMHKKKFPIFSGSKNHDFKCVK